MFKFLSGRWIFTVISAVVFAYMTYVGRISGEQAMALIMLVVSFYFTRADRTPTNGGDK
jgi:hypothetical protein